MSDLLPGTAAEAAGTGATEGSSHGRDGPNHISVITPRELVMTWLAHGVPLALIADLADPSGPASREIHTAECVADDVRLDAESLRRSAVPAEDGDDFSAAAAG